MEMPTSTPVPETRPSTAASTTSSAPATTPEPVKAKVEEVKPVVKETPKANQPAAKGKNTGDLFMQLTAAKEKGNG